MKKKDARKELDKAVSLRDRMKASYFECAKQLAFIYDKKIYVDCGFKSFSSWAQQAKFDPSEANRLKKIGAVLGPLVKNSADLPPARKAYIISFVVTADNLAYWMRMAKSLSERDLSAAVREDENYEKLDVGSKRKREMVFSAYVNRKGMVAIESMVTLLIKKGMASSRGEAVALMAKMAKQSLPKKGS